VNISLNIYFPWWRERRNSECSKR